MRKLKAIFGKLVIRYTRRKYYIEFDDYRESGTYDVVAVDSKSVVIRYRDEFSGEPQLQHIHFDGDFYWIAHPSGSLCEFFRKVADEDEGRS